MRIVWEETGAGEYRDLAQFRQDHPEAQILTIDGRMYQGTCSVCGRLILGADSYGENELHHLFCEECLYVPAA